MADGSETLSEATAAELQELQKKIHEAFGLFDHEANKTVDVREVGTIMRALGCCPSEADIRESVTEMEDEESTGYVHYDRFLPVMTKILLEKRFHHASDEELLMAFRVLDVESKGYLLKDEVAKLMTQQGEKFTSEELEEMMNHALDTETGHIRYRKYAFTLSPIDEL